MPLIHRRVQHLVVRGIHGEVGRARLLIDEKRLLPSQPPIGGFIHTAFLVRAPKMARSRHIYDLVIHRVNDDAADMPGFHQAHVLPGPASIRRFEHAAAPGRTLTVVVLSCTHPNKVGIVLRDGNGADRRDVLMVEDRFPGRAVVHGLPKTACRGSSIVDRRARFENGKVVYAATHGRRTNAPEGHMFQQAFNRS